MSFIEALIRLGAQVDYRDDGGFPALMAALSSDRPDRFALIDLLLDHGADIHAHGFKRLDAAAPCGVAERIWRRCGCCWRGAPMRRSAPRIDDCTTPLEDARSLGFDAAAAAMHEAMLKAGSR